DRGDRRAAGDHDHRRRSDPRARGRAGGRPWHAPRAAGGVRDVPGDRQLADERGGGGMSASNGAPNGASNGAPKPQAGFKATERIQAGPGPGRGPMGGGMVGQKAMDFGPSAKRLLVSVVTKSGPALVRM